MIGKNSLDLSVDARLPVLWIRKLDPVNDYQFDHGEMCCTRPWCASCRKKARWIVGGRRLNGLQVGRAVCDAHARTWRKAKKLLLPDELKDTEKDDERNKP